MNNIHPTISKCLEPFVGQLLETKPVPEPTIQQQLTWALTDLAKCKARLHRHEGVFAEAVMWLQAGETTRAKELLLKGWADL